MFYIYANRRDDITKKYWNRRKNDWQLELTKDCHYPTRIGVNRIYAGMVKSGLVWLNFHELGFRHVNGGV